MIGRNQLAAGEKGCLVFHFKAGINILLRIEQEVLLLLIVFFPSDFSLQNMDGLFGLLITLLCTNKDQLQVTLVLTLLNFFRVRSRSKVLPFQYFYLALIAMLKELRSRHFLYKWAAE